MPIDTKQTLEQINELSRQLLSRIVAVQNEALENTVMVHESTYDEANKKALMTELPLTELIFQRDHLIKCLFAQKTTNDLTQELTLLNEMVSLDSELSSMSAACKKILSAQIIRLKKSKIISKSYQKY